MCPPTGSTESTLLTTYYMQTPPPPPIGPRSDSRRVSSRLSLPRSSSCSATSVESWTENADSCTLSIPITGRAKNRSQENSFMSVIYKNCRRTTWTTHARTHATRVAAVHRSTDRRDKLKSYCDPCALQNVVNRMPIGNRTSKSRSRRITPKILRASTSA